MKILAFIVFLVTSALPMSHIIHRFRLSNLTMKIVIIALTLIMCVIGGAISKALELGIWLNCLAMIMFTWITGFAVILIHNEWIIRHK